MGQHNFRPLKDHAEKLIKFKQDVYLSGAYKGLPLGKEIYFESRGGVCAILTADWLQHRLCGTPTNFERAADISAKDDDNAAEMVKNADMCQQLFAIDTKEVDAKAWATPRIDLLDRRGLKVLDTDVNPVLLLVKLKRLMKKLDEDEGVFFSNTVKLSGQTRTYAHATGFCYKGEKYEFFDSNIGAYAMDPTKVEVFFQTYLTIYKEKLGLEFTAARDFTVCDKSKS